MNQNLIQSARKLRLSGLLLSLEMRLQEANSHQLSREQFLELVLQDELNVRAHRRVERRKKAAAFRELKPLDEFDWDFNPSIKRAQIYELATADFIRQAWGEVLGIMKTQSTERPTGTCAEKPLVVDANTAFGSDASNATHRSFWRTILRRMLVWCVYTGRHRENVNLAEERRWLAWVPKRTLMDLAIERQNRSRISALRVTGDSLASMRDSMLTIAEALRAVSPEEYGELSIAALPRSQWPGEVQRLAAQIASALQQATQRTAAARTVANADQQ